MVSVVICFLYFPSLFFNFWARAVESDLNDFAERFRSVTRVYWTRWCWLCKLYELLAIPYVGLMDILDDPFCLAGKLPSRTPILMRYWWTYTLSLIMQRATLLWANFNQTHTAWIQCFEKIPSVVRSLFISMCTNMGEGALQLLWFCTFAICLTFYTWRGPDPSKQRRSESQASCSTTSGSSSSSADLSTADNSPKAVGIPGGKPRTPTSPMSVLDSTFLWMHRVYSNKISISQLASLAWDQKMRALWDKEMLGSWGGRWCLERCPWNPNYFQLASCYPARFSLIGTGIQGQVKFAQHLDAAGSWTPVAVKVMPYVRPKDVYQADREAATMRAVQGKPHAMTLLSEDTYNVEGGRNKVLAMRFIESVDTFEHFTQLRQRLQWTTDAELDHFLSAVINSFGDIVEGVAHLHAANIAHMDLKPENICMEMKGGQTSTWVVDYGSAMQQDTVPEMGDIQCTPTYTAPEVVNHYMSSSSQAVDLRQISFRAQDMWSLGCLLVWLVIGSNPFQISRKEVADARQGPLEVIQNKHRSWAAGEDMGNSSLGWFIELTEWYPENARVQRLSELAACLLETDRQGRPSASALLEAVRALST